MNDNVNRNYYIFKGHDLEIADLILRRRLQILVHSCIYYHYNQNIITDSQFDSWGRELAKLQNEYNYISEKVWWADAFKGFDGSTGFDLPITDPWVVKKANYILGYRKP